MPNLKVWKHILYDFPSSMLKRESPFLSSGLNWIIDNINHSDWKLPYCNVIHACCRNVYMTSLPGEIFGRGIVPYVSIDNYIHEIRHNTREKEEKQADAHLGTSKTRHSPPFLSRPNCLFAVYYDIRICPLQIHTKRDTVNHLL